MTIQFLGIALSILQPFFEDIRSCDTFTLLDSHLKKKRETQSARVTLEWQKVTEEGKERDRGKRDEIRRDRDLRAKARGITI